MGVGVLSGPADSSEAVQLNHPVGMNLFPEATSLCDQNAGGWSGPEGNPKSKPLGEGQPGGIKVVIGGPGFLVK